MVIKQYRTILFLLSTIILALFFPEVVFAEENPIKKAAESFWGWLFDALPIIGTILIAVSILGAWRNAWNWGQAIWACVVVFGIFYAPKLTIFLKELAG